MRINPLSQSPIRSVRVMPLALLIFCGLGLGFFTGSVQGQSQQLPNAQYYLSFADFYRADYLDARRDFRNASRSAYRFGNRRFLDSVCYWTMMGECFYHMGNYAEAIELYEQALRLYADYQEESWQSRIQVDTIRIQPDTTAVARANITWATPRVRDVARVPRTFQVIFGEIGGVQRALQQGGVARNPEFRRVDVTEIMRCVSLCLHRRRTIKGPTAKYDPLSSQLVRSLKRGARGDGTVMGSYNGVCLAIAYAALEEWENASALLKRSLNLGTGLQHPLTPVGQLTAAYIALSIKNDNAASQLALEASHTAAIFEQFDLVAEALSLGSTVHLKTNRFPYPPLQNAISWGDRAGASLLQATAIVRLAESFSQSNDFATSQQLVRDSARVINRRNTLGNSVIGARLKYVTALNQFLAADFAGGSESLVAAIEHFRTGSLWLYRLQLTNQLAASSAASQRQIDQLYSALLRDPNEDEWHEDPFEAISFLATPHVGSMELWFEVALARRDFNKAFNIAEQVRRHRFFANLPMGGRLMAFRWLLHAPETALSEKALAQRAKFLSDNPSYQQSLTRVGEIQSELKRVPWLPVAGSDDENDRQRLLAELSTISNTQEAILASHSLRREPAEMVFPPRCTEKQIRSVIRPDQILLTSLATGNGYHFFLVDQSGVLYSGVLKTRAVHNAVGKLLKQMGANEASVDVKKLNDSDWQSEAAEISDTLFAQVVADQWDATKELVVVPDGALWYLPFQILQLGEGDDRKALGDQVHVRYSPTVGLAFGGQRPVAKAAELVVVTDRLSPKTDIELTDQNYAEILDPLPAAVRLPRIRQSSNLFGGQIDRLLAWSYIKSNRTAPLATRLLSVEQQGVDGGTLADWLALPWGAPQHVILPGYQSPGLTLKGRSPGSDMFLTTTGLMAAGCRTVLISRWNTAGQTSFVMTGNYAASLTDNDLHQAFAAGRRSVEESDVAFDREPRVRSKPGAAAIKATHPYFWSTYMLLGIPDGAEPKAQAKPGQLLQASSVAGPDQAGEPKKPADIPAAKDLLKPKDDLGPDVDPPGSGLKQDPPMNNGSGNKS